MRLPRAALGHARAVARSGRSALTDEVERAIDAHARGAAARGGRTLDRPAPGARADGLGRRAGSRRSPALSTAPRFSAPGAGASRQPAYRGARSSHRAERGLPSLASAARGRWRSRRRASAPSSPRRCARRARGESTTPRSGASTAAERHSGSGASSAAAIALVTDAALAQLAFLVVAASVGLVALARRRAQPGLGRGRHCRRRLGSRGRRVLRRRSGPRPARRPGCGSCACASSRGRRAALRLALARPARRARARDRPARRRVPARARRPEAPGAPGLPRRHGGPRRVASRSGDAACATRARLAANAARTGPDPSMQDQRFAARAARAGSPRSPPSPPSAAGRGNGYRSPGTGAVAALAVGAARRHRSEA